MNDIYHPPAFGEKVISLLLTDENSEEILGDLAELFNTHGQQDSVRKAQIWYWVQVIRSGPALLQIKLSNILERNREIMSNNFHSHKRSSLWISLIAVIPALVLIIPGILQSGFGYFGANDGRDALFATVPALEILINPIILMGGLLLAFVLNISPAMAFRFERKPEGLTSTIVFKPALLHWMFIGASVLMIAIILVYAFVENFQPAFH